MSNTTSSDQTRFAAEEPMFENIAGLPPDENPVVATPKKPFFKRKGVIVGLIVGSTVLVLVLLFIVNVVIQRNRKPQVVFPGDTTIEEELSDDPLLNRVTELKRELRSADPNQVKFVFPSVNMELSIDEID